MQWELATSKSNISCPCSLRPTRPTSLPPCHLQAVHSVPGPVLDWPQLRRRHGHLGLHRGGSRRGLGQTSRLDRSIEPLQEHVLPHPVGPGASGAVPLPRPGLQLGGSERAEPGVRLYQDGDGEWVVTFGRQKFCDLRHGKRADLLVSLFSIVSQGGKKKEEESKSYVTVTIDTTHKVKDHYNVHEILGW